MAKTIAPTRRTKHTAVRFHFVKEAWETGDFSLFHVPTKENLADPLTKPTSDASLRQLVGRIDFCLPKTVGNS